jgi:hypothetical protein
MEKWLVLLVCGSVVGCDFTVPLVTTPGMEIDKSVLGLWQRTTEDGKTEQLLVLRLEQKEYLVSYPLDTKEGMYARACVCRADDKTFVQLKWFGTAAGKTPDDNRVYQFATYSVTGDKLTVRMLNSDVVNKDVSSTKELVKSIAANRDKPDLFKEGMVFTKLNKGT